MMLRFRLRLAPDDNGTILVTSPDIPIVTYGVGETEALRNAVDAINTIIESMMKRVTTSPCHWKARATTRFTMFRCKRNSKSDFIKL